MVRVGFGRSERVQQTAEALVAVVLEAKTPGRLIERIVETVRSRSAKGDVFLR